MALDPLIGNPFRYENSNSSFSDSRGAASSRLRQGDCLLARWGAAVPAADDSLLPRPGRHGRPVGWRLLAVTFPGQIQHENWATSARAEIHTTTRNGHVICQQVRSYPLAKFIVQIGV